MLDRRGVRLKHLDGSDQRLTQGQGRPLLSLPSPHGARGTARDSGSDLLVNGRTASVDDAAWDFAYADSDQGFLVTLLLGRGVATRSGLPRARFAKGGIGG